MKAEEKEAIQPDSTAVLAAAGLSAAAVGAPALLLFPSPFAPWPAALAALYLAALTGSVSVWGSAKNQHIYPLAGLILLPLYRLGLFFLRFGMPPWPLQNWQWLTAGDFLWWGGASLAAVGYAGTVTLYYLRIRPRLQFMASISPGDPRYYILHDAKTHEPDYALLNFRSINRLFFLTVFIGALIFTAAGSSSGGFAVALCASCYLATGFYFLGKANARRKAAGWREEGILVQTALDRLWLAGYGRLLWLLPCILLLLPGGFRPLHLEKILRFLPFVNTVMPKMVENKANVAGPAMAQSLAKATDSWLIKAFVTVIQYMMIALVACLFGAFCLMLLLAIGRTLLKWLRSMGPIWRALASFFSGLRKTLDAVLASIAGENRSRRPRKAGEHDPRIRPVWPVSAIRRLFARLVLWGRDNGYDLRVWHTPEEIGRGLEHVLPGHHEDLNQLIQGYRRERYGGIRPDRRERRRYQEIWRRTIGGDKSPMALDLATGVFNKPHLMDYLAYLREESSGSDGLCLAMIDLDDFKALNDSKGHLFGDKMLKGFAHIAGQTKKLTDIIGRYGGDEFLIVFPNTSKEDAERILSEIRSRYLSFGQDSGDISKTFSAGLLEARGDQLKASSIDEIISQVDGLLYQAKSQGKNITFSAHFA